MLPHDLPASPIPLPPGDRRSAVYLSGNELRHLRLGYLIQRHIPGLLKAWWIQAPARRPPWAQRLHDTSQRMLGQRQIASEIKKQLETRRVHEVAALWTRKLGRKGARSFERMIRWYLARENARAVEAEMFGREVEALRQGANIHPVAVDSLHDPATLERLEAVNPYFIIASGGPPPGRELCARARGLALSQHAGFSPDLRGAFATETALYHRQIGWVGNTVHVMDTYPGAGAILRRSTATLHPDDTLTHCFLAVFALGNKLMLEVLHAALVADALPAFAQPDSGQTMIERDFNTIKRDAIRRDLAQGWLGDALRMVQDF